MNVVLSIDLLFRLDFTLFKFGSIIGGIFNGHWIVRILLLRTV